MKSLNHIPTPIMLLISMMTLAFITGNIMLFLYHAPRMSPQTEVINVILE